MSLSAHPPGGNWCGELWRAWFNLTLIIFSVLFVAATSVISLLLRLGVLDKPTANSAVISSASLSYRGMFFCNPQIRLVYPSGPINWESQLATDAPGLMILMNHTSFLDVFMFTSICSPTMITKYSLRTMMAAGLFKIPLLGWAMGKMSGSFAVFFKAKGGLTGGESSDFGVDREAQEKESANIQKHLASGGGIAVCPEGTVSKSPPHLQTFRKGAFTYATKYGMRVAAVTMLGCYDCWPKRFIFGGYPCTIYLTAIDLFTASPEQEAATVADEARVLMQAELERLLALKEADQAKGFLCLANRGFSLTLLCGCFPALFSSAWWTFAPFAIKPKASGQADLV